jgi:hypothetical protein
MNVLQCDGMLCFVMVCYVFKCELLFTWVCIHVVYLIIYIRVNLHD